MQQATLLRPRKIYQDGVGPQARQWVEGQTLIVPDDVAERIRTEKGANGKPVFRIEPVGANDPDADVAAALGIQLKFKAYGG